MMTPVPRIYADFHNADDQGRLRLTCVGTLEDLAKHQLELREGLLLTLYMDDEDDHGQLDELLAEGIVSFSEVDQIWVAAIDWSAIRHASDDGVRGFSDESIATAANGGAPLSPQSSAAHKAPPN